MKKTITTISLIGILMNFNCNSRSPIETVIEPVKPNFNEIMDEISFPSTDWSKFSTNQWNVNYYEINRVPYNSDMATRLNEVRNRYIGQEYLIDLMVEFQFTFHSNELDSAELDNTIVKGVTYSIPVQKTIDVDTLKPWFDYIITGVKP